MTNRPVSSRRPASTNPVIRLRDAGGSSDAMRRRRGPRASCWSPPTPLTRLLLYAMRISRSSKAGAVEPQRGLMAQQCRQFTAVKNVPHTPVPDVRTGGGCGEISRIRSALRRACACGRRRRVATGYEILVAVYECRLQVDPRKTFTTPSPLIGPRLRIEMLNILMARSGFWKTRW